MRIPTTLYTILTIGNSLTGTIQTAAPGGQLTSLIGLRGSQMLM